MNLEKMIKRAVILPDVHLTDSVPTPYLTVKGFIKDFKPHEIILLGDFMDISSLSAWDYDKKRPMEGRRFKKEVNCANRELDFLQKHTEKITYIEGNHEDRVNRYLDKNPEMEGMIEIRENLRLKDRKIKWWKMNKLYKLGDMHFTHGMWTNKYNAQKHLTNLGCNITYGHAHGTQTAMQNMAMQKPYIAYALGCLCGHEPDYLKGRPANWINQFGVMYYDTKNGNFNLYPINIIKNKFVFNGRLYNEKN